ncbi:pyocin S6 family toxin immunity protein [Pseudomonas sp. MWU16-30322]|uniref:pyocin S6 family toxin immunity protein n=1 Tax=Pseudomonas sp. MWU16-30322 TaxID=2878092 RepID=UPI001CFC2466|nr:pyocin S6 family toxin immunity protein [Pseudomonas sp. MWU16-30322]
MYLCITGFLPDSFDDSSLKYELDVDPAFNDRIVKLLGHKSLNAMAEGEWLLTAEQSQQIAMLTDEFIPTNLELFIGIEM